MKLSYLESFFSSLMIGAGECFFAAYLLSKGFSEVLSGFVVGLPMMMGALLQLTTLTSAPRKMGAKSWVLLMATLQGLCLLALVQSALAPAESTLSSATWIFCLIAFYWAFGFSSATVWNFWMGQVIVDHRVRARYFSIRGQLSQYGIIAGLAGAGFFLHRAEIHKLGAEAFALPFVIGFISRLLAVYLMGGQSGLPLEKDLLAVNLSSRGVRPARFEKPHLDLYFIFCINCAVFISSPFVVPFLIAKLEFDRASFMATQMALFIGKAVALLASRTLIVRFGVRRILLVGALGMAPLPAMWMFIEHTSAAVALQGLSGMFWGLYEVALMLVIFSEFPTEDKVRLMTWNHFFSTIAVLIGTLIGGQTLIWMMSSIQGYETIFVLGSALRLILIFGFLKIVFLRGNHTKETAV